MEGNCRRASRPFAASPTRARPSARTWLARGAFFHGEDLLYLKFLIPEGARVLELGCGTGDLLAALKPSFGVGVDFSAGMIAQARKAHPDLTFVVGDIEDAAFIRSLPGPFDVILIVDTLGALDDCQAMFENLHDLCTRDTRLVVGYFSHLWYPALKFAETVGLKMPQPPQNVLSPADMRALVALADFEPVKSEKRLLLPMRLFGLGRFVNRFVAPLPLIRQLCLRHYTVCRSLRRCADRREVGDHRRSRPATSAAISKRRCSALPRFVDDVEIIFVEGHSQDGTWEEIERVVAAYPQYDIKAMRQPGKGKARRRVHGFGGGARRRADDPRRRPDHAARATAEVLGGDPLGQGRIRQRLPPGLSDGGRGDALPQSHRQQAVLAALHLAAVAALHRHAVRDQGDLRAPTTCGSRPVAAISATSIRSAIST